MKLVRLSYQLWFALVLLLSGEARAAGPLMVVVEPSNAFLAPDDVRAAVAAEMRASVLAPLEESAEATGDVLIVAVTRRRAVLTFRTRQGEMRRRSIDLPEGRKDQLRTLGWIAVNLVTNQVDGLAEQRPATGEEMPLMPAAASANELPSPAPKQQSTALEPPPPPQPPAQVPVAFPVPVEVAKTDDLIKTDWSVSAFLGPRMSFWGPGYPESRLPWKWTWSPYYGGQEFDLEIQKRYADWQLGAALDMGQYDRPAFALAVFVGNGWGWRKLRLDGNIGLGLEIVNRPTYTVTETNSTTTGTSSYATVTSDLRPRPFGRGNITLAWQMRPAVALLLRLGLHLSPDSVSYCYGAALLGLRVNIP
jgi:hypothetical protein